MRPLSVPTNLYSDVVGFQWLCYVAHQFSVDASSVRFDFSATRFIDGNLCAILGALLDKHQLSIHSLLAPGSIIRPDVARTLSMNNFAATFGGDAADDYFDTTVKYRRFELNQSKDFAAYLGVELLNKELPLTEPTKKSFRTALLEVFNNARLHSGAETGVFSCGQHFPTKENINYTMVDLGIGFSASVSKRFGFAIEAKTAIPWAVVVGHSSRPKGELGGFGLDDIKTIISANEGVFQILSGDAFWEWREGKVEISKINHAFSGTIVNLQINTSFEKHQEMESEAAQRATSDSRSNLL